MNQHQQLADRSEITDLVYRLGVALDEQGFEQLRHLLAADVTVTTPGGTAHGPDEAIAQAARNHTPQERVQHVITGVLVEFDDGGGRANVRANALVHFAPTEGGSGAIAPTVTCTLGGTYRFEAVRVTDGWRLARIESGSFWMSGSRPRPATASQPPGIVA